MLEKYETGAFAECLFNERKIVYKSDPSGDSNRLKYEVFETLRLISRNDKNLKIAIDSEHFYPLETVLTDFRNDTFRLFREGYEKYIETERQLHANQSHIVGSKNVVLQQVTAQTINIYNSSSEQ